MYIQSTHLDRPYYKKSSKSSLMKNWKTLLFKVALLVVIAIVAFTG
jgi:hypothetical protein